MARPYKLLQEHIDMAQHMARTGCSLKQAATELEIDMTSEECMTLSKRASFQRMLFESRHVWHTELARDPNFSKDAIIGKMLVQSQKLEEEGFFDKASEVIFKIAKMMGYVGPESTVSVFGELSQKDLDSIRESVQPKVQ